MDKINQEGTYLCFNGRIYVVNLRMSGSSSYQLVAPEVIA
jgi:hypothetical protein